MSDSIFTALIGLGGVVIGAALTSYVTWRQESGIHKRWLIEKRIEYLKDEIRKIDKNKATYLNDLQRVMSGEKFGEGMPIDSVPMEVIEVFQRHLPNGNTSLNTLTIELKRKIWTEVAVALENKKQELEKNIKKLLS